MKPIHKNIFNLFFLFIGVLTFAQQPSFYIRSLRSISMQQDTVNWQAVTFKDVDIVYNKIIDFSNQTIKIDQKGTYEVNGFVNINPGVFGKPNDSIQIAVYWIKNFGLPSQETLYEAHQSYSYGNFDVARSFVFPPKEFTFQRNDEITIWTHVLPTSTIPINNNKNYHQINKPTGLPQIAALRIAEVLK